MVSVSSTSFRHGGLRCGTSYWFGVEARDAAGNRSARVRTNAVTVRSAPHPRLRLRSSAGTGSCGRDASHAADESRRRQRDADERFADLERFERRRGRLGLPRVRGRSQRCEHHGPGRHRQRPCLWHRIHLRGRRGRRRRQPLESSARDGLDLGLRRHAGADGADERRREGSNATRASLSPGRLRPTTWA